MIRHLLLSLSIVAGLASAAAPASADGVPASCGAATRSGEPTAHPDGGYTPVLLVHGFLGNPGMWQQSIDLSNLSQPVVDTSHSIAGNLRKLPGAAVYTLDYRGVNTRWFSDPGGAGQVFVEAADCLTGHAAFAGHRLIVVGHSMGGLIARWAVTIAPGAAERAQRVGLAVTLGTPYEGSWLAAVVADILGIGQPAQFEYEALRALVHLAISACAGVRGGACDDLRTWLDALRTGLAFIPGSSELTALSPWPSSVQVETIGTQSLLENAGGGFFFNSSSSALDLGDGVVALPSAISGDYPERTFSCRYTADFGRAASDRLLIWAGQKAEIDTPSLDWRVSIVFGADKATCGHSTQNRLIQVTNEVLGAVAEYLKRSEPGYAYLSETELGVVHGTTVTDRLTGRFTGLHYTADGRFVFAVENSATAKARVSAIDVHNGQRHDVACDSCSQAIPVGDSGVAWLDRQNRIVKADLADHGRVTVQPHKLPAPASDFGLSPPRLEAAQDGRLLVAEDLTPGASIKGGAVTVLSPDGSSQRLKTDNVGRIVVAGGKAAFVRWSRPANCPSTAGVATIDDLALGGTDVSTLGDADDLSTSVTDLWWGRDGNLYATMSSKANCGFDDDHLVAASGLYRLDGARWRLADAGPLRAVRKLDGRTKAVVLEDGVLYTETDGKGVEVARGVTSIEMPPGGTDAAATVPILPPGPDRCPTAAEFTTIMRSYTGTEQVRTSGPTACQDGWAFGRTAVPNPPYGYSDSVNTLLHRIDGRWLVHQSRGTGAYFNGLDPICDKVPRQIKAAMCVNANG